MVHTLATTRLTRKESNRMEQYFNLPTIIAVLGLISLFGGAAGYYKASRGDSIIKYQEKESALKDQTIMRQDKELVAIKAELSAEKNANAKIQEHVNFLQGIAQGSPELKLLRISIDNSNSLIEKNTSVMEQFIKKEQAK